MSSFLTVWTDCKKLLVFNRSTDSCMSTEQVATRMTPMIRSEMDT
jgi:hypothetical protein